MLVWLTYWHCSILSGSKPVRIKGLPFFSQILSGKEFGEILRNIGSLETSKQVRISLCTMVIAMKNVRIVQ